MTASSVGKERHRMGTQFVPGVCLWVADQILEIPGGGDDGSCALPLGGLFELRWPTPVIGLVSSYGKRVRDSVRCLLNELYALCPRVGPEQTRLIVEQVEQVEHCIRDRSERGTL